MFKKYDGNIPNFRIPVEEELEEEEQQQTVIMGGCQRSSVLVRLFSSTTRQ